MIDPQISEWISQLLRWVHVITAIAWIGSSFYFIHLDLSLKKREGLARGRRRRGLAGPWRRLLQHAQVPGRAARAAEGADLVQMGELFHLDLRLLPARLGLLSARRSLHDRSRPCAPSSPGRPPPSASAASGLSWLVYEGLCRSPLGRNDVVLGVALFVYILLGRLRLHAGLQRARRLPPHGRDDRHLDVGERLLRHHPQPEEGRGDAAGRPKRPTRRSARRPSSARPTTTT